MAETAGDRLGQPAGVIAALAGLSLAVYGLTIGRHPVVLAGIVAVVGGLLLAGAAAGQRAQIERVEQRVAAARSQAARVLENTVLETSITRNVSLGPALALLALDGTRRSALAPAIQHVYDEAVRHWSTATTDGPPNSEALLEQCWTYLRETGETYRVDRASAPVRRLMCALSTEGDLLEFQLTLGFLYDLDVIDRVAGSTEHE